MSAPGNEAPAPEPAPVVEAPAPVVEAPASEPANAGPWAADLSEYFGDNAEGIAAADRYLREKVQPRMTTLETEAKPALELLKDFQSQPQETFLDVFEEVYGEERASQFEVFLKNEAPAPEATKEDGPALPPEVQEMLAERQATKDAEAYQEFLEGLKTTDTALTDDDIRFIHPFVQSANGDAEAAVAGYREYEKAFEAKVLAKHNVTPAGEPAPPDAPATLGADGTATVTPPGATKEYKTYDQLGDAFDDFIAEGRKAAPAPVGSV